jgi:hypothetical protein
MMRRCEDGLDVKLTRGLSVGVMRSTKCTKLTSNWDQVCNECREASKDESFKSDVQKVIDFDLMFELAYI